MDRSFNSSLLGRSPFSPRSRPSLPSKKIVPTSFRKSSVSGKSAQSVQIILSTPYNYVERFGQPLPVLITEALTFADKNTVVSARISKGGYAWVVCGRRLLIWQYRQSPVLSDTPSKKNLLNQCFELQLPQSDLAHRAELISVFTNPDSNGPSCIAVSPEGVIRYWPAVVHEGVSVEQHVSLQGQECDSLTDVEGLGSILATTTCTVLLILPQLISGRHSLQCKILKIPTGWLGGLSRRMSSFIFGPIASENSTESGIVRVLSVPTTTNDLWNVFVLAEHNLQKWRVTKNEEELLFVAELNRIIRENFRSALWENSVADPSDIDLWLLDLQADKHGVIMLAAAVNLGYSPRVHFALISFQTDEPPTSVKDFLLLKLTDLYREDKTGDFLSFRFLLCGTFAYLYNKKSITVIKPHEEPDTLEFNTNQDFLLAGSVCVNTPIFFSRNHGLVSVASNEMGGDTSLNITGGISTPVDPSLNDYVVVNNLSIYNIDPEEMTNTYKDTLGQLKAAFIYHIKNEEQAYKDIIHELFPPEASKVPGIDSLLDKLVIIVCKDLIDDIPAGDPRWNKELPLGLGSSYSMQVVHQLEDKQKAHSLFIKFLQESGLWIQLAASTIRNTTMATVFILSEFAEKIVAAIALKNFGKSEMLEKALEKAIAESEFQPGNGLTIQDIFFRSVSIVQKGVQELVNYCEDVAHSNMNPTQVVDILNDSNNIILSMTADIIKFREQNLSNYKPLDTIRGVAPDFLPWTVASGSEGLFDSLVQLHYLTYNYGIILTTNERLRDHLFDQLASLTDFILNGQNQHLQSITGTSFEEIIRKQYTGDRQKFLKPFIEEKDWDRAAKLAEKYLDFDTLMIICEATGDQRRLDDYLEKFNKDSFSEHVYNWFLKENKQGKLLNMCKDVGKSRNIEKVTSHLSTHPFLSWMQDIFDKKFKRAGETLWKLATEEMESLSRRKTLLSLSKLLQVASGSRCSAYNFLELIQFQEEIPDYVFEHYGYSMGHLQVLLPSELIHLYICVEYVEAGEIEFKKALDLLAFITEDDEKQKMLLKIWRHALLRDNWDHANLDSPLEILQNKLFFKLVDFTMALDGDNCSLLPALDVLLEDDCLSELENNTGFQFLMKTGYEHIYRNQISQ